MEKQISFRIDGGWLTDFVRRRYWYEGLSYEDSFKLLEACLVPPDLEVSDFIYEAISGVLTGKKKLVGINEVSVEDDNKSKEYFSFLRRKRKSEQVDSTSVEPDSSSESFINGHRTVEVKVFCSDKHLHPFEFYDGTVEEYLAVPDPEFTSNMGLISPSGDFYGCTFASHLFLAQHLIERDPVMKNQFDLKYGDCILPEDRSLDFLLMDRGWITLRNPSGGSPRIDLGKYSSEDELPQKMVDCLWDYRISLRDRG